MLYKRPESVLVVIYTATAEVLLMQRCDVPTFWQSVTGSLREQETPIVAAKREVKEETGLDVDEQLQDCHEQNCFIIKPPWKARYAPGVTHNIEHVFRLKLPTRQVIQLNPQEHQQYCWLSKQQALKTVSSYTNRDAILKYVLAM
jgi:dATP pyrophosphohydrolase